MHAGHVKMLEEKNENKFSKIGVIQYLKNINTKMNVIFELKNAFNDYESKSTVTKIIKSYYTQL